MTKKLTMAAWTALFLSSVAVADTPPTESTDYTVEDETVTEAEAAADITTVRIGDEIEADTEFEMDGTVASATVEGEVAAGGEEPEADEAEGDEMEPTETE